MARPAFTPRDISSVVGAFYARIRAHPELGPVFGAHVQNWPEHEAQIGLFWRNVLLQERGYSGNPMQRHLSAGNVRPHHFQLWLALFDEVLAERLSTNKAQHWSQIAHRIGRSLKMGLQHSANDAANTPPLLKA